MKVEIDRHREPQAKQSRTGRMNCRVALLLAMTTIGPVGSLSLASIPAQAGERSLLWDENRDFAHCAQMTLEFAMQLTYTVDEVDGIVVDQCFPVGRAAGLDETAMREAMWTALGRFTKPPKYQSYDPRAFR